MRSFTALKSTLKDKWLNYYKENQDWIIYLSSWTNNPDEGDRPSNELILGVISILEPRIKTFLILMLDVDSDAYRVINALGLNFDPRLELEKSDQEQTEIFQEDLACMSLPENDFYEIIVNLKDQWLDFYHDNQHWINNFACWQRYNYSEAQRPKSQLILGIISLLEPKVVDYIIPLCIMDSSADSIIKALGLNFRPQTELEKRDEERKLAQEATLIEGSNIIALLSEDPEYRAVQEGLDEIRAYGKKQENSS